MAVSERAAPRMRRVLDGLEFDQPASLYQFSHALRCSPFDLVIVGCMFDGSRAIEAIRMAKLHAAHVPLACVRAAPFSTALGEATLSAFHAAAEELGADCFVDLLQFADDVEGNSRVRTLLERLAFVT
jgi:hypothetical protein